MEYRDRYDAVAEDLNTSVKVPVTGVRRHWRPTGDRRPSLQLSSLRVTRENVYHALPAERWAYFLQNADSVTPEEVCRIFPDEKIAGFFEMTSEHLKQLARDIARQKYQRDGEAR